MKPRTWRFQAKWIPVRVKKTRQTKKRASGSDSMKSEKLRANIDDFTKMKTSELLSGKRLSDP
jgi:hypothetical protein